MSDVMYLPSVIILPKLHCSCWVDNAHIIHSRKRQFDVKSRQNVHMVEKVIINLEDVHGFQKLL